MNLVLYYLDGFPHRVKKGHWPVYYELGAGQRFLTCCARSGGRSHNILILVK